MRVYVVADCCAQDGYGEEPGEPVAVFSERTRAQKLAQDLGQRFQVLDFEVDADFIMVHRCWMTSDGHSHASSWLAVRLPDDWVQSNMQDGLPWHCVYAHALTAEEAEATARTMLGALA